MHGWEWRRDDGREGGREGGIGVRGLGGGDVRGEGEWPMAWGQGGEDGWGSEDVGVMTRGTDD